MSATYVPCPMSTRPPASSGRCGSLGHTSTQGLRQRRSPWPRGPRTTAFPEGGAILDLASALGGPARFLARRFAATVICLDLNPRMHAALMRAARAEGLTLCCLPVLARTERLPLATASCDGAW